MTRLSGKIGPQDFDRFIRERSGSIRREVTAGPQFGVDVAVVELSGGMAMAMTSDPLSLIPSLGLEESAWLSVHLMANDMATTGFPPQYGQFVLNLPADFSRADFQVYWDYIHRFCSAIGVAVTGGHTGFIENQNSTIAGGGTFVTVAPSERILVSRMARPGDVILVTKSAAISSAALLAMSFPEKVRNQAGEENYRQACEGFYQTSVLEEALVAAEIPGEVNAMHDVTEGGVLGAIYELAAASDTGALIYPEAIPVREAQQAICRVFSLDPLKCIGAGSMILSCAPSRVERVKSRLQSKGIACAEVGVLTDASGEVQTLRDGRKQALGYTGVDPYWEAFFKAYRLGWK